MLNRVCWVAKTPAGLIIPDDTGRFVYLDLGSPWVRFGACRLLSSICAIVGRRTDGLSPAGRLKGCL